MGNHTVGRAFVAVATSISARRKDGETALDILDQAADASEVRGMDAEFDDAIMPGEPMWDLIVEAFGEGKPFTIDEDLDDDEEGWDAFYDGPYAKFNARYGLC